MEIRGFIVAIVMLGVAAIITGSVVLPMLGTVNTTYAKQTLTNATNSTYTTSLAHWDSGTLSIWNNLPIFFILALLLGIVALFTVLV